MVDARRDGRNRLVELVTVAPGDEARRVVPQDTQWVRELELARDPLDLQALYASAGRVLDVGAGAGRHTLFLQERGLEVVALDVEPIAVELMRELGVRDARVADLWSFEDAAGFDTLLMLGGGLGLIGRVARFPAFAQRLRALLRPGGCALIHSHESIPLAHQERVRHPIPAAVLIDERRGFLRYGEIIGEEFDWCWVGAAVLEQKLAPANGLLLRSITHDAQGFHYLAVVEVAGGDRA